MSFHYIKMSTAVPSGIYMVLESLAETFSKIYDEKTTELQKADEHIAVLEERVDDRDLEIAGLWEDIKAAREEIKELQAKLDESEDLIEAMRGEDG
jgi:peptidoglycan hydrolase CwlO-like protein